MQEFPGFNYQQDFCFDIRKARIAQEMLASQTFVFLLHFCVDNLHVKRAMMKSFIIKAVYKYDFYFAAYVHLCVWMGDVQNPTVANSFPR